MNLGSVRDYDELLRRLLLTAIVLIAYRFGSQLPLPGIAGDALSQLHGAAPQHVSILALGITPYVTVLIFVEFLKVVIPPLRRWELSDAPNREKLNRIVVGLGLIAAGLQASGLVLAMEDVQGLVEVPGTPFRLAGVVTLVAGSALVIWFADVITRRGIGSGVWLLVVVGSIAALPGEIASLMTRSYGAVAAVELVLGWGLLALILAALIGLMRANNDTANTALTGLWSVLLADMAWPWLVFVLWFIVGDDVLQRQFFGNPLNPVLPLMLAGLIVLFAHLFVRSLRLAGAVAPALSAGLLGCALAAILFLGRTVPFALGLRLPLAGQSVLITVVALIVLQRWWRPPFPERANATTPDA